MPVEIPVEVQVAAQVALPGAPYDSWRTPGGDNIAYFYRTEAGFLVRFPDQADFLIDRDALEVRAFAVSEDLRPVALSLFHNAIVPLIDNYSGGTNLHGSAVLLGEAAIAFLGDSRRGKTTLAGAFARAGHPFLTEDRVHLLPRDGTIWLEPSRPVLRLFRDSASFLLNSEPGWQQKDGKCEVPSGFGLPFSDKSAPLRAIYLLGDGSSPQVSVTPFPRALALSELMRHAFILDVEDRSRLHAHFDRMAYLSETVPCFELDYPRNFDQIPDVIEQIRQHTRQLATP